MKNLKVISLLALLMLTQYTVAQEQKKIVISDSLKRQADELAVKVGTAWMGKIYKFKFGAYGVGESKMGWAKTTQKSAIFNRKTEMTSEQKIFFELKGPTVDVAYVNAARRIETEALQEWIIFSYSSKHVQTTIGKDEELLLQSNNITAFMNVNNDSTDVWTLIMTTYRGNKVNEQHKPIAFFTNGIRKMFLVPVTSNDNGEDKRRIPAHGYELRENGQGLAAVQFYGGGTMGMNKNIIWLHQDVDPKTKLLLAAALTTVLQSKMDNPDFFEQR